MTLHCTRCGSSDFRASRVRLQDLTQVLVLRFPVRCRSCMLRSFTFVKNFLDLKKRSKLRHRERGSGPGTSAHR